MSDTRQPAAVSTEQAPAAIGPYSQAVTAGPFIFVSGQLPIDPATGSIEATTAAAQTEQVIANLGAVLKAAGTDLSRVVKTSVFVADIADFDVVNQIYARHFVTDPMPARSTFEVARLPRAALVEIEVIALIPD